MASECSLAAVQLVTSGLFPCSPIYPTLAVDIRVLDFVRRLFLRIAPNVTAWCNTVTDFLACQGYGLPGEDPLRRRFANALQWYMSLHDMTTCNIDTKLNEVRAELIPEANVPTNTPPSNDGSDDEDDDPPAPTRRSGMTVEEVPDDDHMSVEEGADEDEEEEEEAEEVLQGRKHRRSSDTDSEEEEESGEGADAEGPRRMRPSEYLCAQCPLCFGGASKCVAFAFAFEGHFLIRCI